MYYNLSYLCSIWLHKNGHKTIVFDKLIIIIIYPLTPGVIGAPQMISQFSPFFPVLHYPLGPAKLQACPFPNVVFPPLSENERKRISKHTRPKRMNISGKIALAKTTNRELSTRKTRCCWRFFLYLFVCLFVIFLFVVVFVCLFFVLRKVPGILCWKTKWPLQLSWCFVRCVG